MDKPCIYCEGATDEFLNFIVCNSCKTVCFTKNITDEEKTSLIEGYIKSIQCGLLKQQDFLHKIEQKHINGEKLSDKENEIRVNLLEFHNIRMELNIYKTGNGNTLNKKNIKNLLYRLLMISEWLSTNFARCEK